MSAHYCASLKVAAASILLSVLFNASVTGDDWPMWRYDAGRTAASPTALPDELDFLWSRVFTARQPVWDDPLNHDLMTYDRVLEPIVLDGRLLVGFNDQCKVSAYDTSTGDHLWTYYTEAPVRLPPVGWRGKVYFSCDDGYLYCVTASSGNLHWKFRGAPNAQHALGNGRLTSAWPARGGPVLRDGIVYFAASIWPFMGTFIYALDAENGNVHWVNDATGAQYLKQPHSAPAFAGVAPQGALVATRDFLFVPGGRSVPAALDRQTGRCRYFRINEGGKGTGGSFLVADDHHYYVHTRANGTRAFEAATGADGKFRTGQPVLGGDVLYAAEMDEENSQVVAYDSDRGRLWTVAADGNGDLILAGGILYAAGSNEIVRVRVPEANSNTGPELVGPPIRVQGQVRRLLAADGKLFAVTQEGNVFAFGSKEPTSRPLKPMSHQLPPSVVDSPVPRDTQELVQRLLSIGTAEGYAFWYGAEDLELIKGMAASSPFQQLVVVDSSDTRADSLRRQLDAAGLYGRITVHICPTPAAFHAPQYTGNMVFVSNDTLEQLDSAELRTIYGTVRPYGGVLVLLTDQTETVAQQIEGLQLPHAVVEVSSFGVIVRRVGALPGSADWTHQYGDVGNTLKSDDQRVKLPLGVLWFGGSSNEDVLPRHGHGPPEQVTGGRLIIEGMDCLSARDVYTGRVFWKRQFEDLGTYGIYYDSTYEHVPLDTRYNQKHIPGAGARGTNVVAIEDRIYLAVGGSCHVLDAATGKTLLEIDLPAGSGDGVSTDQHPNDDVTAWGYLGVYGDILLGGCGMAEYRTRHDLFSEDDKKPANFGLKALDKAASQALIGFDRHTGDMLWRIDAHYSFWHNGIVAGGDKVFCLDRYPKQVEDALRRRGTEVPNDYRIIAVDARTGETAWEIEDSVSGTWLGYQNDRDALLLAGAASTDRLPDETSKGMAVYRGIDGSLCWENKNVKYAGPCILHDDLIIAGSKAYSETAGAFDIETGEQRHVVNPLTSQTVPWTIRRAYGCNYMIASTNLLTFRSGAAGFYDLQTDSGTGNFGGFKSGCSSNLVIANGVLNAPDYTRTCSCPYQNQTSLALVHMPGLEWWTNHTLAVLTPKDQQIRDLAVNFGAPGDRVDSEGRVWIEYPVVTDRSPPIAIQVDPATETYRRSSPSTHMQEPLDWVLTSGIVGVQRIRINLTTTDPEANLEKPPEGEYQRYWIRLLFGAPQHAGLQRSVFDVYVQDKLVARDIRLDPTGTAAEMTTTCEVDEVSAGNLLDIRFEAKLGQPLLSGLLLERLE